MLVKKKKITKLLFTVLALVLFILSAWFFPSKTSAATLIGAADYITTDSLNRDNVGHSVSFTIPTGGHEIVATDYIRIILTNFTNVTAPTSGNGWGGAPAYGVSGNVATITGVTAGERTPIGISGITATNPGDINDFDVTIEIANDAIGTIVYDSVNIEAMPLKKTIAASVTVGVPTSSIELLGYTSPNAFVTILLNGLVGGTTTADINGNFHKKITGLDSSETYSVGIFAQDTQLRQSQTLSFIVFTLPFTNHIYSNIVIPPTISLNKTVVYRGDLLGISGLARPQSQITVFVSDASTYSDVVQANASGVWIYYFDTGANPLLHGGHVSYAREVVIGGFTSIFSQAVPFEYYACIPADINCDTKVNLTDFSIMLFYWQQTNPGNPRADINRDNKVDLIDFSIMLYYWTG